MDSGTAANNTGKMYNGGIARGLLLTCQASAIHEVQFLQVDTTTDSIDSCKQKSVPDIPAVLGSRMHTCQFGAVK
jgi:hypothetical protein